MCQNGFHPGEREEKAECHLKEVTGSWWAGEKILIIQCEKYNKRYKHRSLKALRVEGDPAEEGAGGLLGGGGDCIGS